MNAPSDRLQAPVSTPEFVALLALLFSLVALSIDAMLPAIGTIARELGAAHDNDRQLIIGVLFLGLAVGQLVYGPLSDGIGRKPSIFIGLAFFIAGTVLAALAETFPLMLLGRALEGFGAAAPRIVAVAMVRDLYEGRAMARIMSLATSIFILVPVLAPALGQGILLIAHWRMIFLLLLAMAVLSVIWLGLRQPETLPPERRSSLAPSRILRGMMEVMRDRQALGYTLATGMIFAAFVAYLQMSQQIFAEFYGKTHTFPFYFGLLVAAIGLASIVNARLVMKHGMRRLAWLALLACSLVAAALLAVSLVYAGKPPFWSFIASFMALFFFNGLLYGNFNALAMENMGHIAGTASAVVGAVPTFISMAIGSLIARAYDASVIPLVLGFAVCSLLALAFMALAEAGAGGGVRLSEK
ncbi:MAG: multidrug effflux MFS transporter [Parvibaculaceae bacterium]